MGNFRIPVPIAVAAWAASGLAVLSYTYLAFKETANGSGSVPGENAIPPAPKLTKKQQENLVSQLPQLPPIKNPTPTKPLVRNRFKKSKR